MGFSVRISDARCKFAAAHFLYQHDKCSRLHGHNYIVNAELKGKLNEKFFVVDFFDVKSKLMEITNHLDHHLLIPKDSEDIHIIQETPNSQIRVNFNGKHYEFPPEDVCLLPLKATTAELLAEYIHRKMKLSFPTYRLKVEVGESKGSIAIYQD